MVFCRQDVIESTFDVQKNSELLETLQGEQNLESWHSPQDLIDLQILNISTSVNSLRPKAEVLFTKMLLLMFILKKFMGGVKQDSIPQIKYTIS